MFCEDIMKVKPASEMFELRLSTVLTCFFLRFDLPGYRSRGHSLKVGNLQTQNSRSLLARS